ncbi:Adenine specific dna methylase mod [uncultured Stenotrophomonas sp.]|uniref:site-specific DNA-methyltransferase (adenine-specific) n=1 Tax=uncultured Stenotrophomonas sp. TaxID=165438 RepID=A0A1Y5Q5S7_9GAMM|nr:Adenine specific dna methylase mod [uncultured Stenotrophomonas sp.]
MSNGKQKLELTWVGKDKRPKLEPRILLEDSSLSHHAAHRVTEGDIFDNRLIFGDNLLALKALEQEFAGKVKCVFIDPPYNTGSAFTHYDDGLEHSIWLGLMRDRLEIIRRLLSDDGSLWITIDDNEAHYLKVLCDEIFGRLCFIADIAWKRRDGAPNDRKIGSTYDHVLVYAKTRNGSAKKTVAEDSFNLMERTEKANSQYQAYDEPFGIDPRGPFRKVDSTGNAKGGRYVESLFYAVKNPFTGEEVWPRKGRCWVYKKEEMEAMIEDRRFFWGKDGKASTPMRKLFKSEAKPGMSSPTIWDDVGLNQHAAREIELLFGEKASFETPKPEGLMRRIVHMATNPGDLVLDSFAGSGTTGAVAHKMGRRWIMVELGEHIHTHIIPRLKKVIDGQDKGGVTESTGWQGGGGFRYYKLAPSLIVNDRWGNPVINPDYNATQLAEALCKLEGFTYAPSETRWWQHGHSSEHDFLYVTTQNLSAEQLQALSDDVGSDNSLLIMCSAFHGVSAAKAVERWPNLTVKKIPKAVLAHCEWGHDDYSLNVANLPVAQPEAPLLKPSLSGGKAQKAKAASGPDLFGNEEDA